MGKKISIVISVYNEGENVIPLYEALSGELSDYSVEILFVNDGSTDKTLDNLLRLYDSDNRVKIVNLSRNFGHEVAMTAGMDHASGEAIVFMDGDFQHPPEVVPVLIERWRKGAKVVLTHRISNGDSTLFSRMTGKFFYHILNRLSEVHISADYPDFRLLDSKYVSMLKKLDERNRVFRAMLNWIGPKEISVVGFHAPGRREGHSHYAFSHKVALAFDGIIQFSIKPLRIATILGLGFAMLALLLGLWTGSRYFMNPHQTTTGYYTIVLAIISLGAVQLLILGVLGEYIGRIHQEVKRRPLYIADFLSNVDSSVTKEVNASGDGEDNGLF